MLISATFSPIEELEVVLAAVWKCNGLTKLITNEAGGFVVNCEFPLLIPVWILIFGPNLECGVILRRRTRVVAVACMFRILIFPYVTMFWS